MLRASHTLEIENAQSSQRAGRFEGVTETTMSKGKTKVPGEKRAKAWVYTVINPLKEGLEIEAAFLARKNWTFRPYKKELEFIRPLESYIEFQCRPNWEDFIASNPAIKQQAAAREPKREQLRKKCEAALAHLDALAAFRNKAGECLRRYKTERPQASWPGEPAPEEQFHRAVAERVINNIQEVLPHYSDSEFWAMFREDLMQFRQGEIFESLDEAGLELGKSNNDLSAALAKVREELAAELDIPWAPYYEESPAIPRR